MKRVLVALLLGCVAQGRTADNSLTVLDRYLNGLTSLRTQFTQNVTDSKGKQVESGAGTLLVQRPGKFRWDYTPTTGGDRKGSAEGNINGNSGNSGSKGGQLLVADGKNLWFYDRELAQVTVKPETEALSATPVMLLSGSSAQLRDMFEIEADGTHDGMDWVRVKARSAEADFGGAQLGFSHDQLLRMRIDDRLGQTVQMDFSHSERNARVSADDLQFKPPQGVDVIGTQR